MTQPSSQLRIIEPNLRGNAGHYGELVRCICLGSEQRRSTIFALGGPGIEQLELLAHPRIIRKQAFGSPDSRSEFAVLRDCVRDATSPCLVLTAKASHSLALEACAWAGSLLDHVRLLFHWREATLAKRIAMTASRTARRECRAIAPTTQTADFLRAAGWRRVIHAPYPAIGPDRIPVPSPRPIRLLMAGAARINKGIALIPDLAMELERRTRSIDLLVQVTGKRGGQQGRWEAFALERLQNCRLQGLQLDPTAPDRAEYERRFRGALVLTPYDPVKFSDNVSGVALDALLNAAPIVATAGSWQAGLVERFGCGVIMERWDSASLIKAVDEALARWSDISLGAVAAATQLAVEHHPLHLARAVMDP